MQEFTLEEARARLSDLIEAALAGETVYIARDELHTVQLVPLFTSKHQPRFGSAKGLITLAPDFDEPLPDFDEYTQ